MFKEYYGYPPSPEKRAYAVRFCLIATLLLTSSILHAEEPVSPEDVSAGGKTLAEWRKMAGMGGSAESGSILSVQQQLKVSPLDAYRASLMEQQEVLLHNLVNLGTIGYKRIIPIQMETKSPQSGQLQGSRIIALRTDFSQGPLVKTGRPLDLAIDGPGFFTLQDPRNHKRHLFTRQGCFSCDETGTLGLRCGKQFYPLAPRITLANPITSLTIAQLKLQTFVDRSLLNRSPEGFFELSEEIFPKNSANLQAGKICQGMLEFSNVDKVGELQKWDMTVKLLKDMGQ